MAPRVAAQSATPQQGEAAAGEHRHKRRARRLIAEVLIVLVFGSIVYFKIFSYTDPSALSLSALRSTYSRIVSEASSLIRNLPFLNSCPNGLAMHDISGGYVCAPGPATSVYDSIYQTYPLSGGGRESIYASTDEGSVPAANDLLHNVYDVQRYAPFKLSGLPTWTEDPYSANYWRFEFYSLRPSLNLLYAFRTTGNQAYARKLVALDLSFVSAESKSKLAWADPHAVAFRSMSLVDAWWKLRQAHQLSEADSTVVLGELEKTGQFLANPNNYQSENNHALNESAALYELSIAFPTLPNAQSWLALAKQRFHWQLSGLIDADGQLIENSPYYDFYALEKYLQIYQYSVAQNAPITSDFKSTLDRMTNFAAYILQPNSQIPLLGASLEATVNDFGVLRQLAAMDPNLKYALTHGASGTEPPRNSVYFPASELTVMRSGWQGGAAFENSTYLTYNIGEYRTEHSDLDALAVTLYGEGGDLLPGAGLYTYTPGAYRNYFHGTVSENTVAVDGKSQVEGNGNATALKTVDGITYQSGQSALYSGVTHQRVVMMIDPDHILVIDHLNSADVHDYQQMWHLFPGAKLTQSGLTVTGTGGTPQRQVTMQQILPQGITESAVINRRGAHPAGLCSQQYGQLLPCYQIAYTAHVKRAEFVTLITIGSTKQSPALRVTASQNDQLLTITQGSKRIRIGLGQTQARAAQAHASDPTPPKVAVTPVPASSSPANWTQFGAGTMRFARVTQLPDAFAVRLSTSSSSLSYLQNDAVQLNLRRNNAEIPVEINGYHGLSEARLILSNDHWNKTVTLNLLDALGRTETDGWTELFLAASAKWGHNGGWLASTPGFDWSHIDGIEIEIESRTSGVQPSTVSIGGLSLLPEQNEGKLVIVFDDGYQSILSAADYLHKNGMPANVAVIGKYVDYETQDHLNLDQLKQLQNDYGWDMVNHTQRHADAVQTYYDGNNLSGYAADILQQAAWLEANGLNSAPNWFIYPHGDTNNELERVVGRYYMFARVVQDNPEDYPYGNPLAISDLEVQYPGDEGDGANSGLTSPATVASAVQQAVKYHTTLVLTFHRIHALPGDPAGYPLALFEQVVNDIRQSGIKVMTLSQLDQSNGVPLTNRIVYTPAQPAQITVRLSIQAPASADSFWARAIGWLVGAILLLALLLGIALWMRSHQNGARKAAPAWTAGRCEPRTTGPSAQLSDRYDKYDKQVLSYGPVLYLPLGNPSSPLASDLSGNRHSAAYESAGRALGTARLPNGDPATVFDGNGQYAEVPSFPALSVTETGCLTVEAWIRPDTLQFPHEEGTGYVYILGKGTSGQQQYALRMYSFTNTEVPPRPNRVSAYVFNLAGGLGSGSYFQHGVRPGEWMMVTFVVDAKPSAAWPDGYVTIYQNGKQAGRQVSLGQYSVVPRAADAPFRIGTRDLNSFFEGAIGKVAVYDSVLSSDEILATYQTMMQADG